MIDYPASGFKIGDGFVYFSKYDNEAFSIGVVEKIMEVKSLERGVYLKKYYINNIYDSKEIYQYASIQSEEEKEMMDKLSKNLCRLKR